MVGGTGEGERAEGGWKIINSVINGINIHEGYKP
jgi:ABC-type transporter MlaC component